MYSFTFHKFYFIIACCEDIYGWNCIQKSSNDHFHPLFAIIVFKKDVLHFLLFRMDKLDRGFLY